MLNRAGICMSYQSTWHAVFKKLAAEAEYLKGSENRPLALGVRQHQCTSESLA